MTDSAFTFLSWMRRGLATAVSTEAGVPSTQVAVTISLNPDDPVPLDVIARLDVLGPGDIVGLDPSVIVRVWPSPDDLDAEFVSYPLIEFDQADLPWRYSPEASADTSGNSLTRVRPWLSLVVLKSADCSVAPPTPDRTVAVLTVNDANKINAPESAWAWGHTQIEGQGVDASVPTQLLERITGEPGLFSARLLSPRLLEPNTEYTACLVPTFERGRRVGTGELTDGDATAVLDRFPSSGTLRFPAYYSWRFRTGTIGNFEYAARLIQPVPLPQALGRRDMDVSNPGFQLDPASNASLPVEGALMSVAAFEAEPPEWPATERDQFIDDLKSIVNEAAEGVDPTVPPSGDDPRLTPPLYAQWYAATDRLKTPKPGGPNPAWFYELNTDPRNRVAAALGTRVIQRESQALLASGWNQVEGIRAVNDALRVLQLGRAILGRIFVRHFTTLSVQRFYHLTLRLHAWVECDGTTVCGRVKASPTPPAFMSAQWLRLTRQRGPVGRLQGRPSLTGFVPNLFDQFNQCRVPAPEPPTPPGLHEPKDPRGRLQCTMIDQLEGLGSSTNLFWGLVILWVVRELMITQSGDCWWMALKALRYAINLIRISISVGDVRRRCRWFDRTLTVADIQAAPTMPSLTIPFTFSFPLPLPFLPGGPGSSDSADAAAVRAALIRLIQKLTLPAALDCGTPMDPAHCYPELKLSLDPQITVGERLLQRRSLQFFWSPSDILQPLFAPPKYERPMYLPLSEVSFDWILPGLNGMQHDSVGLAVTNQRFIEAYMAGLNHEMTRELLWNEFPTDQRGTYFRQFWDISGCVLDGSPVPPEQLRDIHILREWDKNKGLGEHSPRTPGGGTATLLVLVVRAQLIRKYPNVIVYLQRRNPATNRLTGEQRHPVFTALLEPDIAFYGFQATVEEIRNDTSTSDWYFVLQEQPGDPKFTDPNPALTHDGSVEYSDPATLGADAAAIAQSTFLEPFRIGFAAKSLLPAES